jgi:hypothetical protein
MTRFFWTALVAAALIGAAQAPALAAAAADPASAPSYVTDKITVSGAVEHTLVLSVDDLRQFPQQQISEVTLQRQSGADAGKLDKLKGVLLRDILQKAAVVSKDHNDVKKIAVIAGASDGYKVVFSWSEIFNSPLGDGIIVFFERDGAPLAGSEGRIAMISTRDTRTGPRHVKWLQTITVTKIAD